jgi:hypothetical protein
MLCHMGEAHHYMLSISFLVVLETKGLPVLKMYDPLDSDLRHVIEIE